MQKCCAFDHPAAFGPSFIGYVDALRPGPMLAALESK
jgi:hypothetical protein